jgi:hypothetical protein
MGMTSPHLNLYIQVIEKYASNNLEVCPFGRERTRRKMNETYTSTDDHYEPGLYQIRIRGHLADRWANWFGDMTITLEENGDTLLTGPVVDQAALHALLRKVRDSGMTLISVSAVEPGQADVADVKE